MTPANSEIPAINSEKIPRSPAACPAPPPIPPYHPKTRPHIRRSSDIMTCSPHTPSSPGQGFTSHPLPPHSSIFQSPHLPLCQLSAVFLAPNNHCATLHLIILRRCFFQAVLSGVRVLENSQVKLFKLFLLLRQLFSGLPRQLTVVGIQFG